VVVLVTVQCCNLLDAGPICLLIRSQFVAATAVSNNRGLLRLLPSYLRTLSILQTNIRPDASFCISTYKDFCMPCLAFAIPRSAGAVVLRAFSVAITTSKQQISRDCMQWIQMWPKHYVWTVWTMWASILMTMSAMLMTEWSVTSGCVIVTRNRGKNITMIGPWG